MSNSIPSSCSDWSEKLARASQGDFSPVDQSRLNGEHCFKLFYRNQLIQWSLFQQATSTVMSYGKFCKVCSPIHANSEWPISSFTAVSSPEKLYNSIHENSAMYEKFLACGTGSLNGCYSIRNRSIANDLLTALSPLRYSI